MSDAQQYRRVNRSLGKAAKIGPLPAIQILPLLVILFVSYFVKNTFRLTWVQTALFGGWLMGTSWIVFGERPWRYLSRFVRTPHFIRGGVVYISLLKQESKKQR